MRRQLLVIAVSVIGVAAAGFVIWNLSLSTGHKAVSSPQAGVAKPAIAVGATAAPPAPVVEKTPDIVPGDMVGKVVGMYGPQPKEEGNFYTWDRRGFRLAVKVDDSERIIQVLITWGDGPPLATPDGVVLGKDTLASVRVKLQGRFISDREDFGMQDGVWFLTEEVRPRSGVSWVTRYDWYLNEGITSEKEILDQEPLPHTPEVFKNVPVTQYEEIALPATG